MPDHPEKVLVLVPPGSGPGRGTSVAVYTRRGMGLLLMPVREEGEQSGVEDLHHPVAGAHDVLGTQQP
ncbi:hypothetical protein GCM10018780_52420 [Streptomyces lanatus]|nr:hypothetical protein GCM10018780_52420 [Streptomyces lanatus]